MATDFFNLHVHYSAKKHNKTAIVSFDASETEKISDDVPLFSVGIHPWHVKAESLRDDIRKIALIAEKNDNCVAVGECGLDRIRGEFPESQTKAFIQQIKIANSAEKPLIIHCVRCFPELIAIKKQFSQTTPWIVHGFNGNRETAEQLLKHGIYLSFGENLRTSQKLQLILKNISENCFFLETDQAPCSIDELYKTAAKIRKVPLQNIITSIDNLLKSILK